MNSCSYVKSDDVLREISNRLLARFEQGLAQAKVPSQTFHNITQLEPGSSNHSISNSNSTKTARKEADTKVVGPNLNHIVSDKAIAIGNLVQASNVNYDGNSSVIHQDTSKIQRRNRDFIHKNQSSNSSMVDYSNSIQSISDLLSVSTDSKYQELKSEVAELWNRRNISRVVKFDQNGSVRPEKQGLNDTLLQRKRKFEAKIDRKINSPTIFDTVHPAEPCCKRYKCSLKRDKFTPDAITDLRLKFHSMPSKDDQRLMLSSLQSNTSPTILGEAVCYTFFSFALQISQTVLANIRKNGYTRPKLRESVESETEASILNWLDEFAKFHEYMPNKQIIQLPYASKSDVFQFYLEDCRKFPLQFNECHNSYFNKIWKTKRKSIVLRAHLQFALCDICVALRVKRDKTIDETMLNNHKTELFKHLEFIKQERTYYESKKAAARGNSNAYLSMVIDGADQSAYGMPHFCEITKTSSHAHKQRYHLIGVIVHGNPNCSYMYTCTDRWEHGSNSTIEVLQRTLKDLESTKYKHMKFPDTFYLQMDNCWRENKNRYVLGYLCWLAKRGIFKEIYLSFLPVGHTHSDIDQAFSRTSLALRSHDAPSRVELYEVIKASYKPSPTCEHLTDVANMKGYLEDNNYLEPIVGHTVPLHFKICPGDDPSNDLSQSIVRRNRRSKLANSSVNRNPLMWTKAQSHHEWTGEGFSLLRKEMPCKIDPRKFPAAIPKGYNSDAWHELKEGLSRCRDRLTTEQFSLNEEDLTDLQDVKEVPFHWPNNGQFLCEMENNSTTEKLQIESEESDDDGNDFKHLDEERVRSSRSQMLQEYDLINGQVGDFAIVEAGKDDTNQGNSNVEPQRFWLCRIKSIFNQAGKVMWGFQWYQSDQEFGKYMPCWDKWTGKIETSEPYLESYPQKQFICRFKVRSYYEGSGLTIPKKVVQLLKSNTWLLENENTNQQY